MSPANKVAWEFGCFDLQIESLLSVPRYHKQCDEIRAAELKVDHSERPLLRADALNSPNSLNAPNSLNSPKSLNSPDDLDILPCAALLFVFLF